MLFATLVWNTPGTEHEVAKLRACAKHERLKFSLFETNHKWDDNKIFNCIRFTYSDDQLGPAQQNVLSYNSASSIVDNTYWAKTILQVRNTCTTENSTVKWRAQSLRSFAKTSDTFYGRSSRFFEIFFLEDPFVRTAWRYMTPDKNRCFWGLFSAITLDNAVDGSARLRYGPYCTATVHHTVWWTTSRWHPTLFQISCPTSKWFSIYLRDYAYIRILSAVSWALINKITLKNDYLRT